MLTKWKTKIVDWPYLGALFLSATTLVVFFKFTSEASLIWRLEMALSLFLGLAITLLKEEKTKIIEIRIPPDPPIIQEVIVQDEQLLKEFSDKSHELLSLQADLEQEKALNRSQVYDLHKQIQVKAQKIITLKSALKELEKGNRDLMAELEKARQEAVVELPPELETDKSREFELKYIQTRKQFEEKSEVLSRTRAQLFQVENQLLALQKAFGEKDLEEPQRIDHFADLVKLQEEVLVLEAIISKLCVKKSPGRPKKAKTNKVEDFLSTIM